MSKPKNKTTNDAVEILHRRLVSSKPEQMAELERIRAEDAVARKIYDLRTQAGISQRALAKLVAPRPPPSTGWRTLIMRGTRWPC